MNTVTINNKQFPVIEYRSQRVVTFAIIDDVHQRPEGTARAAFNRNRSHFIEGVDFLEMTADVIRTESLSDAFAARTAKGIILFESGYLMLTKPFNDALAWQVQRELVNSYFRTHAPLTEMEMIAAMAADAVRQQKCLSHVEEKIETVTKAVENIKRGTMRTGYVGYRQVVAKSGMSDAKCRNEFMTPDGLVSRRAVVELETFMVVFHQMMSEAEPRGTRWYHPKMGLFQVIGWEDKA